MPLQPKWKKKSSGDAGANKTDMNITTELPTLTRKIQALESLTTSFATGVAAYIGSSAHMASTSSSSPSWIIDS